MGCFSSKDKAEAPTDKANGATKPAGSAKPAQEQTQPPAASAASAKSTEAREAPPTTAPAPPAQAKTKLKVYLIYYSTYGHIEKLIRNMAEAMSNCGAETAVFAVRETLPEEVLEKMSAPQRPKDHAIISPAQLPEADAFVFGVRRCQRATSPPVYAMTLVHAANCAATCTRVKTLLEASETACITAYAHPT